MEELIQSVGQIDSYTAKLLLRETYETMYQIFNHDDAALEKLHPLSLVAQHPKEDPTNYSLLYRTIYRFSQYDIHQLFGLNLDQFLELPREICELLFRIAKEKAAKETGGVESELKQLENQIRGVRRS